MPRKHVNPTVLLNRAVANRKLASLGRFERPTQGLEILCSIQLNYGDKFATRLFILLNPTLSAYCKQKSCCMSLYLVKKGNTMTMVGADGIEPSIPQL